MLGKKQEKDIEALILGCEKNNRRDQRILYDQYFESLYVHCRRYKIPDEESLSLINATMLKIFQNIHTVQKMESFSGWVYSIHKNQILNYFRKLKTERKYIDGNTEFSEFNTGTDGELYALFELEHIHKIIEGLPEMEKKVVTLYAIEGYNYREISEKLKISESASKWHMKNAREKMAQRINTNHG